jgi:peptide/nickel transport system permease protein
VKRANLSFWIGALLCLAIAVFAVFPQLMTAKSPYATQTIRFWTEDGSLRFERSPFAPSDAFPLGTDDHGRDVWSLIVYGTRLTMLIALAVVVGRFVIALPLALLAGFGNAFSRSLIRQFGILFSAIPALLLCIVVLRQDLFQGLEKALSVAAFVVVLSLVGWGKLGTLLLDRTEGILRQPFIRSEVAIGKPRFGIAMENVVPHLAAELIVLFFMEIARALALLMQLGIFGVFVGNLRIIMSTDEGVVRAFNTSFEPEWASMLGTAGSMIYSAPWMVIAPALAFFVSVLAFNLLGEGVRAKLQDTGSSVIHGVRSALRFDLRRLPQALAGARGVRLAVGVLLLTAVLATPPVLEARRFRFTTPETAGVDHEAALLGSAAAQETAELIRSRMVTLGVTPLRETGYYFDYRTEPEAVPEASRLVLSAANGPIEAQVGRDYVFDSVSTVALRAPLYDASRDDLLTGTDTSRFADRFVLFDSQHYGDEAVDYILRQVLDGTGARGVLVVARAGEPLGSVAGEYGSSTPVLTVSRDFGDTLREAGSVEISLSVTARPLGSSGRNVVGIHGGNDPALRERAIFVGLPYNYSDPAGREALLFGLEVMERLCTDIDTRRSVIFAFLDGTTLEEQNGIRALIDHFPYNSSDIDLYLDLTGVRTDRFDSVVFSSRQAPITRYYAWTFARLLETLLDDGGIPVEGIRSVNRGGEYYFPDSEAANAMFWGNGIATVIVGTPADGQGKHTLDELGGILLRAIGSNDY